MDRSKSGISPVMATVILVAIAIVIAIAVAFWATGLVGVFTRFEKIDTLAAYSSTSATVGAGTNRVIVLHIKNTGSAAATVDNVYINGKPCIVGTDNCGIQYSEDGGQNWNKFDTDNGYFLDVGAEVTLLIDNDASGNELTAGVIYEVAIHTASGKSYPYSVEVS